MADDKNTQAKGQAEAQDKAEDKAQAAQAQPAVGQNTVETAPPAEAPDADAVRPDVDEDAKREAEEQGNVNALGQPRATAAPNSGAAFGTLPRAKYEVDPDELGTTDPLAGTVPGSEHSAALDSPESPHIGKRYIPGSANVTSKA